MKNKEFDNIEGLFQTAFDGYKVQPSEKVWLELERKMAFKRFFKFSLLNFNVFYLSVIALSATLFVYYYMYGSENSYFVNQTKFEFSKNYQKTADDLALVSVNQSNNTILQNNNVAICEADKNTLLENGTNIFGNSFSDFKSDSTKNILQVSLLQDSLNKNVSLRQNNVVNVVDFSVNTVSGCMPLEVCFQNNSKDIKIWKWNFGDGNVSFEKSPKHVFTQAGVYNVVLNVIFNNGEELVKQQFITVNKKPEAKADIQVDNFDNENVVYFYNNSSVFDQCLWNFGDNNISREFSPRHIYAEKGNFNVSLIVWNSYNCSDTVEINDIYKWNEIYRLNFPNAFIPSEFGGNGGFYNENDRGNEIFRPVTKGVVEMKLQIFNRLGVLVFETNELNRGWDGYTNNRIAPEGVYIWKATGKFENGRSFVEIGDVTLLYSNR